MKLAIVSTFPPEDERHPVGSYGASSYTKNLVDNLSQKADDLEVFSNCESYSTENYDVIEAWNKGVLYPLTVLISLRKKEEVDTVHIQHEMFLYGGILSALVFPILPFLLKAQGKKVVITLHTVPQNIDAGFCEIHSLPKLTSIWKIGAKLYFRVISFTCHKMIVHEEIFRKTLSHNYNLKEEKIEVISHGVEEKENTDKTEKEKNTILFFGFVAPYKGVEKLIDIEDELNFRHETVIAGGKHPRTEKDDIYDIYYQKIKERASEFPDIETTGWVEEDDMPYYFRKADVLVLPYKDVFSASGPLHLALAYRTHILASRHFDCSLPQELVFKDNAELIEKLNRLFDNQKSEEIFNQYLEPIREKRLWSKVSEETYHLYEELHS